MKTILLSVISLVLISSNSFAQKKNKEKDKFLDGKVYVIELQEENIKEGKKIPKPISDDISFKSNKIKSKVMKEKGGFENAYYTVAADSTGAENTYNFESEMKNESDETAKWMGKVVEDNIEGTIVWKNRKGEVKREYSFSGTWKVKK